MKGSPHDSEKSFDPFVHQRGFYTRFVSIDVPRRGLARGRQGRGAGKSEAAGKEPGGGGKGDDASVSAAKSTSKEMVDERKAEDAAKKARRSKYDRVARPTPSPAATTDQGTHEKTPGAGM